MYKIFDLPQENTVSDDLPDNKLESAYHVYLLRGLNEGLADFWGWMYTGNPDFIADSLPIAKQSRTLTIDGTEGGIHLYDSGKIQDLVRALMKLDNNHVQENLANTSYNLGTQFSRILKVYADQYGLNRKMNSTEARREVAKIILKTLPLLKEDLLKKEILDFYEPSQFLVTFLQQAGEVMENECEIVAAVINGRDSGAELSFKCQKNEKEKTWELQKQKSIFSIDSLVDVEKAK